MKHQVEIVLLSWNPDLEVVQIMVVGGKDQFHEGDLINEKFVIKKIAYTTFAGNDEYYVGIYADKI